MASAHMMHRLSYLSVSFAVKVVKVDEQLIPGDHILLTSFELSDRQLLSIGCEG